MDLLLWLALWFFPIEVDPRPTPCGDIRTGGFWCPPVEIE